MTAFASRDAWTTRVPQVAAQPTQRAGTALHWLGMRFDGTDHSACLRVLHSIEEQDVRDKGFGAIPYNQAVCRHDGGTVIEGRGVGARSGANGSRPVNERFGSVCALVGVGEQLSDGEWEAIHRAVLVAATMQAPGKPVLTHSQVRPDPTACPGPELSAWVQAGCPTEEEFDVTADELRQIVREEIEAALNAPRVSNDDGTGKVSLAVAAYRGYSQARKARVLAHRAAVALGVPTAVATGRPSENGDVLAG